MIRELEDMITELRFILEKYESLELGYLKEKDPIRKECLLFTMEQVLKDAKFQLQRVLKMKNNL